MKDQLIGQNGWRMQWHELRPHLGLDHKKHLPDVLAPQIVTGSNGVETLVWIRPRQPGDVWCSHRVMAQCNGCKATVPAGRMQQHKCK